MKKLFSHDSNIIQSLILMFNLMVLNIFWLLLCVPVITAGAATTAMYYTLYQYVTDGSESVIKPFFKTFIKDFKQSTVYWLIMLVIGFVLWCDISFLSTYTQLGFLWILLGILLLLCAIALTHGFAILGRFDTTLKTAFKSCYLIALTNFWRSLLILIFSAAPVLIIIFMPYQVLKTLPLWVGIAFAAIFYINARLFIKSFENSAPKEETPSAEQ